MLDFDPITLGNAAACQIMSYYHVEKDRNRKEHLNLKETQTFKAY